VNILALIPARSGSKSIKDKNIRLLAGKPLMAWSIAHALSAQTVTRTIVSTDSIEYAEIAKGHGAEVPFLRPPEISGDRATDLETFQHALNWLKENEGYRPDFCVHLRPTHPVRNPADIDRMVEILVGNPKLDSVRSVAPAPETPFKMWFRDPAGLLRPVVECDVPEAYNQPRQRLPQTYLQNASIDVVRSRVILEQNSMTGCCIHGYIMDANYDIDDELQLEKAGRHLVSCDAKIKLPPASQTFVFDIDGVVATLVPSLDYALASPNVEMIRTINFLYEQGHCIVLSTARGSKTGKDWQEVTRRQLTEWGVKHHQLLFGKPTADYYVDDRALLIADVFELARQWGMSAKLPTSEAGSQRAEVNRL
jgi:CMP-N-acetylneuraminic acid synthetase